MKITNYSTSDERCEVVRLSVCHFNLHLKQTEHSAFSLTFEILPSDFAGRSALHFCCSVLVQALHISISSNFRGKIFGKTGDEDSGLSLVQVWSSLGDFIVRQMKRLDGPRRKSVSLLRITIYESDSYSSFSVILSRGTAPFEGFRILICTKSKEQIQNSNLNTRSRDELIISHHLRPSTSPQTLSTGNATLNTSR